MRILLFLLTGLLAVSATDNGSRAADATQELVRFLPSDANTVSVVRVRQILETPRAQAEGWSDLTEEGFLAGASRIPPWVDTIVIASLVRPAVPEEVWSSAVLRMPSSVTMERLARREESRVIRLAGSRAVQARRDAMLIELQPRILGIRSPAVRQETAHWSRQVAENSTGSLSPVLQQAVQNPAHIVLGIDLRDMVDAQRMRLYLNQSGLMPEDAMARVELPQLLTTLRGVYVLISITDTTSASVVIEFGADVGQVGDSVAAVFRQLMKDLQMSIDEFDTSTVTSQGNSVRLSMMLSDESLRRAVSLITAPSPEARANDVLIPSEPLPPESAPPRVTIELNASKRYFRAVSQAIDDLARVNRKASEYSRTAIWHDNFARRIEQLSTAGVEPVLLEFGGRVSERFHALAASLRGQAVQINAQQKTLVYNVDYRPGWVARHWWGAVGYRAPSVKVTSNLKEVRERQAAAVVAGTQERLEIWKLINSDRRDVRQKMQARYGDVFFQRRR